MSPVALAPLADPDVGLPPGGPTFEGFEWFVPNIMGVPANDVPDTAWLQVAYDQALNLAYWGLATVPSQPTTPSIYAMAVYNLGCAFLIQYAQDDPTVNPPSTYWADLRKQFNINAFQYGLIQQAADQGTSSGMYISDQLKGMTLLDMQLAKTPWGQAYLMIAGQWGTIWGLTI
jgi:hypothetical protein